MASGVLAGTPSSVSTALGQTVTAASGTTTASATAAAVSSATKTNRPADEPFGYCFNTATIRGQKLSLPDQVDVVAKAGYHAIEPWMGDIHAYRDSGGSLKDIAKRIADAGLTVESAIGFAGWIVDDEAARTKGLESAKRDMEALREIGGIRIAAPPVGATNQSDMNLFRAAERYAKLLEVGRQIGVIPQLELWGFSKTLSRLGELAFVASECGHPDACVLPDVYHIHKGGSGFRGLRMLAGSAMHVFHINDYPAEPPRETIKDADRVYPGDGVAPLSQILADLYGAGFRGYFSLELFNPEYYKQDPLTVAKTGLEKTRAAVKKFAAEHLAQAGKAG